MKGYVDLYILPVPKKNLRAYTIMAQKFSKIIIDVGALEYREFLGDDFTAQWAAPIIATIKLKPGEVLIFAVVGYRSKTHRDQVNKKVMKDPRTNALMPAKPLFDMKRMHYGGFSTIVKG